MTKPKNRRLLTKKKCKHCGKTFTVFRKWAEFCSPYCRVMHWNEAHPRVPLRDQAKANDETESR